MEIIKIPITSKGKITIPKKVINELNLFKEVDIVKVCGVIFLKKASLKVVNNNSSNLE